MYSKTRLGSDQIEGALSLTPRGKRIVYLIVAVVVAAGVAIGVWSAVSHDDYATSANGCVSLTVASSTGARQPALLRRAGQGVLPRSRSPSRTRCRSRRGRSATWRG